MIDSLLNDISYMIGQNLWIAPLAALVAGLLTSVTPCALSSVPLVIGYVGGTGQRETGRSFRLSIAFAVGMAVTFTILGTAASLLGRLMQGAGSWWFIVLGTIMVLMALQAWEVYNFIPSTYLTNANKRRGYVGAVVTGMLGGLFSSPCATPVLVALLTLVAGSGNIAWGVFLLLMYSLGHSVLVVVAGTSVGFVKHLSASGKYGKFSTVLKYGMGAVLLIMGFYLLYLGF
ncbi:MAG: cytochrome c biogenesis protein CcdA [Sphaerochaeta sp.]|jgi:cytochrome c biogenesis protein CcdA|nr:cytochrome c biogenesis protein CcdA [Sphaerochaeta sp.]